MPEDLHSRDGVRINVQDAYELQFWSRKLNTTPYLLRQAVAIVGPAAEKVEAFLRNCRNIGPWRPVPGHGYQHRPL